MTATTFGGAVRTAALPYRIAEAGVEGDPKELIGVIGVRGVEGPIDMRPLEDPGVGTPPVNLRWGVETEELERDKDILLMPSDETEGDSCGFPNSEALPESLPFCCSLSSPSVHCR